MLPVMTKAFDTSVLVAGLEAAGIPAAEAVAKAIVDQVVFPWLSQSLALEAVSNPLFAIGVPLLSAIQPSVDAALVKLLPPVAGV